MARRSTIAVAIAVASLLLSMLPRAVEAGRGDAIALGPTRKPSRVAQVRYIQRGLTVQPPRARAGKGKVRQPLYTKYFLRTRARQKASLGFGDGTVLHMNQLTDLMLRSPHSTYVRRGEVDQLLAPGTNHQVQTASAVATAIGTEFDVRLGKRGKKTLTTVIVVEGVVAVTNTKGRPRTTVTVQAGQETTVLQGLQPAPPQPVDAATLTSWTGSIPAPPSPGVNVALHTNGGRVVAYSSQAVGTHARLSRSSTANLLIGTWDATYVDDGDLASGWSTAVGKTANQWVKIGFAGDQVYNVSSVIIDPAATVGHPDSNDLKNFQIRVSTTGTADGDFQTVLSATARRQNSLQRFDLPQATSARYVELLALDNYGSPDAIDVAEMEIVTKAKPLQLPTPTPAPTDTSTPGPTSTPLPTSTPAVNTYEFEAKLGFNDTDPGDTQGVPVTEEQWVYEIKGYTCGTDPSGTWHMTQHESTNDDMRNLDESNSFDIPVANGATTDVPGAFFPTKMQLQSSANPQMYLDVGAPWADTPDATGTIPLVVLSGCRPLTSARNMRALNLQLPPVTAWQAAVIALHGIYSHSLRPISTLKARRTKLLAQERTLVGRYNVSPRTTARLRRVRREISDLDETIHEYGEMAAQMRGAERRTQQHLATLLRQTMYGTWLKAKR